MLSKSDREYIRFWGMLQPFFAGALIMILNSNPTLLAAISVGFAWLYVLSALKDEKQKSIVYRRDGKLVYEVDNNFEDGENENN